MNTPARRLALVVLALPSLLCLARPVPAQQAAESTASAQVEMSPEVRAYLDRVLEVLERESVRRAVIDWPALRAGTYERARGARSTADAYDAIRYALGELGDGHSFLMTPEMIAAARARARDEDGRAERSDAPDPEGRLIDGRYGYVKVPWFLAPDVVRFADELHGIVRDLDRADPCGWVVDVRGNGGGNMWPMIAGIGPLLGEGPLGGFVDADGSRESWAYRDGAARVITADTTLDVVRVSGPAYRLRREMPPVAVLTDSLTGSSGEMVAIAFRGRPNTRSFGTRTYGAASANEGFPMSDGATVVVTVAEVEDRNGTVHPAGIEPDVRVEPADGADDPVLAAAIGWLSSHASCEVAGDGGV